MGLTITGNGIALYQLLAARSVVRLHAKGLRLRPYQRRAIRQLCGVGHYFQVAKLEPILDQLIAEAEATLQPGDVTSR